MKNLHEIEFLNEKEIENYLKISENFNYLFLNQYKISHIKSQLPIYRKFVLDLICYIEEKNTILIIELKKTKKNFYDMENQLDRYLKFIKHSKNQTPLMEKFNLKIEKYKTLKYEGILICQNTSWQEIFTDIENYDKYKVYKISKFNDNLGEFYISISNLKQKENLTINNYGSNRIISELGILKYEQYYQLEKMILLLKNDFGFDFKKRKYYIKFWNKNKKFSLYLQKNALIIYLSGIIFDKLKIKSSLNIEKYTLGRHGLFGDTRIILKNNHNFMKNFINAIKYINNF